MPRISLNKDGERWSARGQAVRFTRGFSRGMFTCRDERGRWPVAAITPASPSPTQQRGVRPGDREVAYFSSERSIQAVFSCSFRRPVTMSAVPSSPAASAALMTSRAVCAAIS
jgi:hypothetical protein